MTIEPQKKQCPYVKYIDKENTSINSGYNYSPNIDSEQKL